MDDWMDKWMDGWMDAWMDEYICTITYYIHPIVTIYIRKRCKQKKSKKKRIQQLTRENEVAYIYILSLLLLT